MEYINLKKISIKNDSRIDEAWIQARIAENPAILQLGELDLKDRERVQPNAGRLDLLLQDPETARRYEVEIQLGKTDESHIIRTIEYWDIERKRYPQYDHCAVIVAEDITSRFLNVIHLFNGNIPLIAIQMTAYDVEGKIALQFTKVIDELKFGLEEDESAFEITDRAYWEAKGDKQTVRLADEVLLIIKEIDDSFEITYKKPYIGLAKNGQALNFTLFRAKKSNLRMEVKLERNEEIEELLDKSGLDVMEYDRRWGRYRIRVTKDDIEKNRAIIKNLLYQSLESWNL